MVGARGGCSVRHELHDLAKENKMEVIITNPANGRKYRIKPDSNGLCYQLFQTSTLKKGEKARNGKEVKHQWQPTGKYPSSILHGLELVNDLMLKDPQCDEVLEFEAGDIKRLDKYIKSHLKQMAESIEVVA